ncbi:MAG: TIGR02221 family CRISPR-associated protein [Sulfurimonas sp.]|nr:TIGR02221 family CRISPR-associated protein [Sulfurimonas sp.]
MAKILISSLGTGDIKKDSDQDYKKTIYKIDGKEYPETLTAKVLIEHFKIDKVIFIGTNKSMWDNLYYSFNGEDEEYLDELTTEKQNGIQLAKLKKLNSQIDSFLNFKGSTSILIEYEKNNADEIWDNFEILLNIKKYINDGDEIYLDITHGFRYMPILNIFLLEFISIFDAPSVEIKGVFYGMFSENKSEIIDFKIFFDLLEWSKAISMFKHNSNAEQLVMLLSKEDSNNDVAKVFTQFSNNLQLANMSSLWQFIKDANRKIKKIKESNNKIIKLLSDELITITSRFDTDIQSNFQYELAKWLYENKSYALSYLALYEAIISKSCELKNYDLDEYSQREEAKKSLGDDKYGRYFYTKHDDSISQIRNNIVHQSNERKDKVNQDIQKLPIFIDTFESYFTIRIGK